MGAEVIGVSSDSQETHDRFAESCHVKFPLLSDEGGKVRDAYGVRHSLGIIPGRVTFVIDKMGVVRRVYSSQLNPARHVSEAIQALKTIG
jgi:peroxiredoxin Q/BCP